MPRKPVLKVTTLLPAADGEVGASRISELDIQPSPKALPAPLHIDGSVDVAVLDKPTVRTLVDARGHCARL